MTAVGPYRLVRRLASGAMGEVWAARAGDATVAVKFVSATDPTARSAFLAEVGTLARLRHPYVLPVLDHGVLERAVPGGPAVGTPWMANPFVAGGTLDDHLDDLAWAGVRQALLSVLEALAYAHGHGVVHRDMKPSNVLLSLPDDPFPGVRVADFGIAWVAGEAERFEGMSVGSPVTMSPEQWNHEAHLIGPWSDLYAVGCMAWRMVHDSWPHPGKGSQGRMIAHLRGHVVPWSPRKVVPEALEGWVRRMISVAPGQRFLFAADAASALREMPPGSAPVPEVLRDAAARERAHHRGWHRRVPASTTRSIPGWGEGVLAMREWSTVGRSAERDLAWAVLEAVHADGRPRALVWEGEAGMGCTHMTRWLGRAAHREAMAHVLTARVGADDGPYDLLRRLLVGALRGADAPVGSREPAVADGWRWVGEDDPSLVDRSLRALDEPGRAVHDLLWRWLVARSRERPVVVAVEGGVADSAYLDFVHESLGLSAPVVFVIDAGPRAIPARWAERSDVVRVRLDGLSPAELGHLLDASMPFEPLCRARLAQRALGRPKLLRQTLGELLSAGRLVLGPVGFEEDRSQQGPAVTEAHRAMLSALPEAWLRPLRLAAALGEHVHLQLWADADDGADASAAARLGSAVTRFRLQQHLERSGFWQAEGDGVRWTHAALPSELLAVDDAARAEAHGAVAAMYARAGSLRLAGRHEVAAGRVREGIERILGWIESEASLDQEALSEALRLCRGHDDLWRRLVVIQSWGAPPGERLEYMRWVEESALQADDRPVLRMVEAEKLLVEAIEGVDIEPRIAALFEACDPRDPVDQVALLQLIGLRRFCRTIDFHGWIRRLQRAPLRPLYAYSLGRLALLYTDAPPEVAAARLLAAARDHRDRGRPGFALDCLVAAVERLAEMGDLARAQATAQEAVTVARTSSRGSAIAGLNLAQIALRRGDVAMARAALDQAREERDWEVMAPFLDALEWVWAVQVEDYALAWALVDRLPSSMALQELGDALLRPTVDGLRGRQDALADAARRALWG